MTQNANYKKQNDLWDAEAKTTFAKATTDWFSNDKYASRLHMSFVQHDGVKPAPKMLDHIEIGIPMVKAGSDGSGDTGVTALSLASAITTGGLAKKAALSRQKAQQTGAKYAEDIFSCIGGTPSNRSKTGTAEFRKISIAPGQKDGMYALKAYKCEGEDSTTGGVQPKKGAQWTQIIVPVSEAYMRTLGEYIKAEWTAFLTAKRVAEFTVNTTAVETAANPAPAVQQAQAEPKLVYIIYDTGSTVNRGFPMATDDANKAIAVVQSALKTLVTCGKHYVATQDSYNTVIDMINNRQKGKEAVILASKQNPDVKCGLVVCCDLLQ